MGAGTGGDIVKLARIVDTRPRWMKLEDQFAECLRAECNLLSRCISLMGAECKHLGGCRIPKIRDEEVSWWIR
jgi:hypothetical protein